jgi:glyceraldehyde-3-phosphate dehydrogenase (NAD(P))
VIEGRGGLTDLRDVGRGHKRNDCPDLIIWQESVQTFGENVVLSAGVHMESIVIPETLDALFAMTRLELDVNKAMGRSDQAIL